MKVASFPRSRLRRNFTKKCFGLVEGMITNFVLGEMIMIKAVLFDFDGVLTIDKTGSTSITNYLSNICGIPLEDVKACYYKYNKQLLLGEATHLEIWQDFCKSLGHNIDYDILIDSFRATRLD